MVATKSPPLFFALPLKGPTGKAILRPAGTSGPDPTIELQRDRGYYHNTPGHPASEIKFEWKDKKDDRCPFIPPVPESRPVQEPKLEEMPKPYPAPIPVPVGPSLGDKFRELLQNWPWGPIL